MHNIENRSVKLNYLLGETRKFSDLGIGRLMFRMSIGSYKGYHAILVGKGHYYAIACPKCFNYIPNHVDLLFNVTKKAKTMCQNRHIFFLEDAILDHIDE